MKKELRNKFECIDCGKLLGRKNAKEKRRV